MAPARRTDTRMAPRAWPFLTALLAAMIGGFPALAASPPAGNASATDIAAGQRMYREGLLPSGESVRATAVGDVAISSAHATCMSCHRRSGLGSVEGNEVVPPVVGPILYDTGDPRTDAFKRNLGRMASNGPDSTLRPAYDDTTLARAIREGIDPGGRRLDPLMPRYDLSDAQVAQLIAYLKTLSDTPSPGVTDTELHFATVFAGPVAPQRRAAVMKVFEAYFADVNGLTRNEKEHVGRGNWYHEWKDKSYRQWRLHVWDLDGPPEDWRGQLEARYREQPVFAVIGGVGAGAWRPVHRFCADNEIPCVLPQTDLPVIAPGEFYNIYFTKGLTLEAEALARHLAGEGGVARGRTVLQVYRSGPDGTVPATALRAALGKLGFEDLAERRIDKPGAPAATFWQDLLAHDRPDVLVLWLGAGDLAALADPAILSSLAGTLYVSSALVDDPRRVLPPAVHDRLYVTHRFLPPDDLKRMRRLQAWLRVKHIAADDPVAQASAFAAAQIVGNTVRHMRGFFSRDHMIEEIEHLVDSTLTDSPYPRLSLGPGQRFLSRRVYILGAVAPDGALRVVDDMLMP